MVHYHRIQNMIKPLLAHKSSTLIRDGFKKANLGSLLSDLFVYPWWFLQIHTLLWLRISSQFQGSSKRCMITFVAKLLAAFYAFVAAACSGSSSPSVASDSRGVISPISTREVNEI
ncbi:hypothetical protein HID58_069986 [Brassica napus]|uniref:Uncharacterized protein n=1 Tax=Brassica napus TaxID=3708 RepID=A0ABQ7YXG1_BRANA|nr:hypothetical protein HID58_069986 [Brassica napus]